MPPRPARARRGTLTRERVIAGAVELADAVGIEPLTIRRLAEHLDVGPMTLYHYVSGKEDIVDGMVGAVFDEIERPSADLPWREAIRRRAVSARTALRRHPWAPPLMESRTSPEHAVLAHHEAVLACWFRAGFSLALMAHASAVIDAFVYGFALQEAALPFGKRDGDLSEVAEQIITPLDATAYPHLVRFATEFVMAPDYDFAVSFEYGLDLLLDGIQAAHESERRGSQGSSEVTGGDAPAGNRSHLRCPSS